MITQGVLDLNLHLGCEGVTARAKGRSCGGVTAPKISPQKVSPVSPPRRAQWTPLRVLAAALRMDFFVAPKLHYLQASFPT